MRVFDVYVDGKYKRSIVARGKEKARQLALEHYPQASETLEIKERKIW